MRPKRLGISALKEATMFSGQGTFHSSMFRGVDLSASGRNAIVDTHVRLILLQYERALLKRGKVSGFAQYIALVIYVSQRR